MAYLGRRVARRRPEPERYWCVCGNEDHRMALWIEDDWLGDWRESDYGQVTLVFGPGWLPWRARLGVLWDVLRGRPAGANWLTLDYADLRRMRDTLARVLALIEAKTEPEP